MQNPNLELSAILFYLNPTQIRALQSTNKTIRRAALASFKELIYNSALMLPWLQSNIVNLVNLCKIRIYMHRFNPAELETLFQVLNQGTFQLLNFDFIYILTDNIYVHNDQENALITTFFAQHCNHLVQLKIYSQDLILLQNTFPHLKTLDINFTHYKELNIRDAPIWQHRLSKLSSVTLDYAPSWFVSFFLDYCNNNKINLRELALENVILSPDGYRPLQQIVPAFVENCCTRLKILAITTNGYLVEPDFLYLPMLSRLFTPTLQHLEMDFLSKEQFEIIGTQCPQLNHLNIQGAFAWVHPDAQDFYQYLIRYPNSELKALWINNESIIDNFDCNLHTIFPKLIEFNILNDQEVQITPKLWTSLSKCNLEKLFIQFHTITLTFSVNSEFLVFLQHQKNLKEFISSAELLMLDFTMLMNIVIGLPKLQSLKLMARFEDAFILTTYLIHMPSLHSIEIFFTVQPEVGEIVEIMSKFCKLFQKLNIVMPELHTLDLILNTNNTPIIPLIPDFETVYKPMFARNCPKLKKLRLGW
jgi:hypothetical protein